MSNIQEVVHVVIKAHFISIKTGEVTEVENPLSVIDSADGFGIYAISSGRYDPMADTQNFELAEKIAEVVEAHLKSKGVNAVYIRLR